MSKPQVFLSYAHHDREVANQIAKALAKAGIQVFYDQALEAGDNWEAQLAEKLKQSQLLLVLISPQSSQSTYVAREYGYYLIQNKLILPVLIAGSATDIPFGLQRFAHIDLRDEQNLDFLVERTQAILEHGYLIENSSKKQITITFDVDRDTDISRILNQITELKGTHGVKVIESDY